LLNSRELVRTFGALTGAQAVQMVRGGLEAIPERLASGRRCQPGWPDVSDQSLYEQQRAARSCRLNNALLRADQVDWAEGKRALYWIGADSRRRGSRVRRPLHGFGHKVDDCGWRRWCALRGSACAEKKCGHLGVKCSCPSQFLRTLFTARLAADVSNAPTVLVARTDANSATLLTSDIDKARPSVHHG
jgi:isocitrate lyase